MNDFQDKLAKLKQSYRDQLPGKIDEINNVPSLSLSSGEADIRRYLETLEGLSHKLAGSGATFGFLEISVVARSLENTCEEKLNQGNLSASGSIAAIDPKIQDLQLAVDNAIDASESQTDGHEAVEKSESENKCLLIISDDEKGMSLLSKDLEDSGFETKNIKHSAALESVIEKEQPSAIIVDASINRQDESGLPRIEQLRERKVFHGPLIVIADSSDIKLRLQAARANADSYILKPVISSDLVDILDQQLITEGSEAFRILIVDDDISTAKYTEVVLQGAGMVAEHMTDPLLILERLDDFNPELILMDLYMPECSGQELAEVVRQNESFSTIPIVFLSGENDIDKQLHAMRSGGDDFLTKPIKPQHLISSIRTRVMRFRLLRSRMVRDSMTGLINHTTTHEFLDNEVARARRNKKEISVAAIDIDHFKSVNDNHGHAVGDQVIKSLSRLLRQRLRSTDVIGRMGGEEFAAVLAGTPVERASEIFNGIRQAFSEIEHISGDDRFTVTISCGISEYPTHETSAALLEGADKALYEAKNNGRNRVVVNLGE